MNKIQMKKLISDTNNIINKAQKEKKKIQEAINWGDLGCLHFVEEITKYYFNINPPAAEKFYRITIEEASPECYEFQSFIKEELLKLGYKNIEVTTEW